MWEKIDIIKYTTLHYSYINFLFSYASILRILLPHINLLLVNIAASPHLTYSLKLHLKYFLNNIQTPLFRFLGMVPDFFFNRRRWRKGVAKFVFQGSQYIFYIYILFLYFIYIYLYFFICLIYFSRGFLNNLFCSKI